MTKRFIALIALIALALCCMSACSQDKGLRLGTGNDEGMYYQFGTLLAEGMQDDANVPTITVETTSGSSANLRLLSQGFLDMAIVQADTLSDAYNGTGFFSNSGEYTGYSAVAGLYTEACQIIVPADSDIHSVEDLAGKNVSLGERESGVLQNALQILDAYNMQESDFSAEYLSFSESAEALENGSLDAAFITAAIPTPAVTSLSENMEVRVLSLDTSVIEALTKRHSYYIPCTVPAGIYNGQSKSSQTVGVRAVLVARNDVPDEVIDTVMTHLFSGEINFTNELKSAMQPMLTEATGGIPIAFHPGAGRYYADQGIEVTVIDTKDEGNAINASQDD